MKFNIHEFSLKFVDTFECFFTKSDTETGHLTWRSTYVSGHILSLMCHIYGYEPKTLRVLAILLATFSLKYHHKLHYTMSCIMSESHTEWGYSCSRLTSSLSGHVGTADDTGRPTVESRSRNVCITAGCGESANIHEVHQHTTLLQRTDKLAARIPANGLHMLHFNTRTVGKKRLSFWNLGFLRRWI